jgi:hypothetical protein
MTEEQPGLEPDRGAGNVRREDIKPGAQFVTMHGTTRQVVSVDGEYVSFNLAGSGNFGSPARASMANFIAEARAKVG